MAIDMERVKLLLDIVAHNNTTYKAILAEAQAELREMDEEARVELVPAKRPGMPADQQETPTAPKADDEEVIDNRPKARAIPSTPARRA